MIATRGSTACAIAAVVALTAAAPAAAQPTDEAPTAPDDGAGSDDGAPAPPADDDARARVRRRARNPEAMIVNALPGDRPGVAALILIGESGQLYYPRSNGGWSRRASGGVAGDVAGAARSADGTIYVIGGRAPLYRWRDGAWHATSLGPPRRSRASTLTGFPVMAFGGGLYTIEGDRWVRIGSAPTRTDLVWASDRTRAYVVDDAGALQRWDGKAWTTLPHGLPAPERVAMLVGLAGRAPYAIGDAGTIVSFAGKSPTPLTVPAPLTGFRPTATCTDPRGHVLLAGAIGVTAETTRHVLVRLGKSALEPAADLPALASPDDRYSLCATDATGALLVSSYAGTVHLRTADTAAWTTQQVSLDLPPVATNAARTGRRPAKTR